MQELLLVLEALIQPEACAALVRHSNVCTQHSLLAAVAVLLVNGTYVIWHMSCMKDARHEAVGGLSVQVTVFYWAIYVYDTIFASVACKQAIDM